MPFRCRGGVRTPYGWLDLELRRGRGFFNPLPHPVDAGADSAERGFDFLDFFHRDGQVRAPRPMLEGVLRGAIRPGERCAERAATFVVFTEQAITQPRKRSIMPIPDGRSDCAFS